MTSLELDPLADQALEDLYTRFPRVAEMVDESLDWIEDDDVRSRRRRFSNGMWVIVRAYADSEWVVVWEMDGTVAAVRFIGESGSF